MDKPFVPPPGPRKVRVPLPVSVAYIDVWTEIVNDRSIEAHTAERKLKKARKEIKRLKNELRQLRNSSPL